MALKSFNNEAQQSCVILVEPINNSKTWVSISLYRSEEKDELELTVEEARQLREALNEFLND